jgi:hypothetical protein
VDTVRQSDQSFVRYQWPKAGSELPVDKPSYVKGFAPWGWVIGSGICVGEVMREVVQTMEGTCSSSARIGEIIGPIDGIDFQTNILALNAALVEETAAASSTRKDQAQVLATEVAAILTKAKRGL